ncbi:hypothetical protein C8J57DRAFT_1504494 [Mycena rebaudengoi]|nr:hypothetical protein C8J57DRAFT_1504494 [Mycena rebaudengoi]
MILDSLRFSAVGNALSSSYYTVDAKVHALCDTEFPHPISQRMKRTIWPSLIVLETIPEDPELESTPYTPSIDAMDISLTCAVPDQHRRRSEVFSHPSQIYLAHPFFSTECLRSHSPSESLQMTQDGSTTQQDRSHRKRAREAVEEEPNAKRRRVEPLMPTTNTATRRLPTREEQQISGNAEGRGWPDAENAHEFLRSSERTTRKRRFGEMESGEESNMEGRKNKRIRLRFLLFHPWEREGRPTAHTSPPQQEQDLQLLKTVPPPIASARNPCGPFPNMPASSGFIPADFLGVRWINGNDGILRVIIFSVSLSWHRVKDVYPLFAQCLESLPNLNALHILYFKSKWDRNFTAAFEDIELPGVHTIILPSYTHAILAACPNVLDVSCNEGKGAKLFNALIKSCPNVERIQDFQLEAEKSPKTCTDCAKLPFRPIWHDLTSLDVIKRLSKIELISSRWEDVDESDIDQDDFSEGTATHKQKLLEKKHRRIDEARSVLKASAGTSPKQIRISYWEDMRDMTYGRHQVRG